MANQVRDYIAALPAGPFPDLVSLADEFAFAGPGERFEMLIDIVVDGLGRRPVGSAVNRHGPSWTLAAIPLGGVFWWRPSTVTTAWYAVPWGVATGVVSSS